MHALANNIHTTAKKELDRKAAETKKVGAEVQSPSKQITEYFKTDKSEDTGDGLRNLAPKALATKVTPRVRLRSNC